MPIKVAPDPNKPNAWIWVDSVTGEPAVQPGGPGTPYVAPSDLTPQQQQGMQQQQQQQQQQTAATNAQRSGNEAQVLAGLGRGGWTVTGRTDEMKSQSQIDQRTGLATSQLAPTGNVIWAISGPNGQNDTVIVHQKADDPNNWDVVEPPKNLPASATKTPNDQQVTIGGVIYTPDPNNPNGPWTSRAVDQAAQDQARANIQKTLTDAGLNATQAQALRDKTPAEIQQALASAGLSAANTQKAMSDIAVQQAMLPGQLAQQTAQTGLTQAQAGQAQAQTGQIQSAVEIAQAKAPGEIAQTAAQTAGTQATTQATLAGIGQTQANIARTQQQVAQGNAPTVESIATTSPYIYQKDPNTGQLTPQINLGYMPKTSAEVAARVGQLQQMAQAQRDQLLQQQQAGTITAQQATQQFDQWWNQNVEPQKAGLDQAQRSAALDQQRLQQEQARANLATAQTAGSQAIQAMQAQLPYMVGPGFGEAVNKIAAAYGSGKAPQGLDIGSAVTFQMPDINALAKQATDQALAHISPTAADNMNTATGPNMPNFGPQATQQQPQQDVSQALNRTNYQPGGGGTTITINTGQPQQQQPAQNQPGTYGAFSGQMPPAGGYAQQQPGTYGAFSGAMPNYQPALV